LIIWCCVFYYVFMDLLILLIADASVEFIFLVLDSNYWYRCDHTGDGVLDITHWHRQYECALYNEDRIFYDDGLLR